VADLREAQALAKSGPPGWGSGPQGQAWSAGTAGLEWSTRTDRITLSRVTGIHWFSRLMFCRLQVVRGISGSSRQSTAPLRSSACSWGDGLYQRLDYAVAVIWGAGLAWVALRDESPGLLSEA
jgi:hypothetical protein